MGYRKNIKKLLLWAIVGFLIALAIGILDNNDVDLKLSGNTIELIIQSLGFFSASAALSLSILYFLREEIFRSWLRFTKWYLPLAGITIYLSLGSHGGWGFPNIFATELVTMWSAGLFFVLSLIIIIYRTISICRKEK